MRRREGWLLLFMLAPVLGLGYGCPRREPPVAPQGPAPAPPGPSAPAALVKPDLNSLKSIRAEVKPYTVSSSFAEVPNFQAFKKSIPLTPAQEKLLAKNLFACTPTTAEQLFYIYENNDYLNIPSFVAVDAVLHLYHIFYDFTLRTVETDALTPVLQRLTDGMLADSQKSWREATDPQLKQAALKNVAYFGVAAQALGKNPSLPAEAAALVKKENALINAHEGFGTGAIFPYRIDYSQFVPRGHYTRSDALKRFFRAMMWYGLTPIAPYYMEGGKTVRADEQIRQGLLLTRSLYRAGLEDEWETIYEPTAFYVGTADDITPTEFRQVADQTFGQNAALKEYADTARYDPFVEALKKARAPRIQPRIVLQDQMPAPEVQLRFMGQRYIPDSEILQRLSKPTTPTEKGRPFPAGLDVMAVLGSPQAESILDANPKVYNADGWPEYQAERNKLASEFAQLKPETWTSNLYWSWLHTLQPLLETVPEGYPSFMRNEAWEDRSLNTALGSWAELRHDTILYGKQSGAECGGGEEPPFVRGYVEPNVPLYDGLSRRKLLSDRLKDRFENFDELLSFLKKVSEKELRNEALTEEEYNEIRFIGGKLEYLTLSVMSGAEYPSWELISETDRNMAVIADVHTEALSGQVLEEGVGNVYEILAIVPVEGKLSLTRGAVFSYYEFKHPIGDRLTDEKWQQMLKSGTAPAPPFWVNTFLAPKKPRALHRDELDVYSSGC
jgi:uncharacterized protein DUF3160